MFEKKVLDKGFVRLSNISGAVTRDTYEFDGIRDNEVKQLYHPFVARDTDPALVARTSFAKGLLESSKEIDEGLVEYLVRNEHTTPLEFTTVYLAFKMPIFCARQVVRHRTGNLADNNTGNEPTVNEVSGRYVTLPADWYIPEVVRGKHSGGNKQGSEDNLDKTRQDICRDMHINTCNYAYTNYLKALELGECNEQARGHLTEFHYTSFVWKQDLHNLMHFLSLRLDEHAQWEVRQYAEAIYELLKEHLPKSMEWFDTYRRKLSAKEKELLLDIANVGSPEFSEEEQALLVKLAKRQGLKL